MTSHKIPQSLINILKSCENENIEHHHFPPTEVFKEGWMLRLVLDALQTVDVPGHPFRFLDKSTWYSEARLNSPFLPTTKQDPMGETSTHADGVIGNFKFREDTRTGLKLTDGARQFIVVEAKMLSNLSSRISNAPEYDQAARTVACMASIIKQSDIPLNDLKSVGFFVVAPSLKKRRRNTNLEACLEPESIKKGVNKRIESYENATPSRIADVERLKQWEKEQFVPLVNHLVGEKALRVLDWEKDIIQPIADIHDATGKELLQFYNRCLKYA
jgi:hypothetical protein